MGRAQASGDSTNKPHVEASQHALFWIAAAAFTVLTYWLCLRYLFPGYFAPLSPFHVDFYDYVGTRQQSFLALLLRYPRPAAYMGMKIMGAGGLAALMSAEIAIALANVLLTVALARRMLGLYSPWLFGTFAVYVFLLFAHPEFYFEHRHDLPAELSYLFLMLSLLCWLAWLKRPQTKQLAFLLLALTFAVLFVFAKETFFVAALCLMLGLAVAEKPRRNAHLLYLATLLALEIVSFAWNSHLNGPFINANADPSSTYHVNLSPLVVAETYGFYVSHLLTPALAALVCWALVSAWQQKKHFVPAAALALAGLSVFATHAVLPNHKFEEYAWAAAPLFLAPVLVLCESGDGLRFRAVRLAALACISAAIVAGPLGYWDRYRTDDQRWTVNEERRGHLIANSLSRLHAIRGPAEVLVAGLDDPVMPWQSPDYIRSEFGDALHWTIAVPPGMTFRKNGLLTRFVDAADVRPEEFDQVAGYDNAGRLVSLKRRPGIDGGEPAAEVLLPSLASLKAEIRKRPHHAGLLLACAEMSIDWGFSHEGAECLQRARTEGAPDDSTFQRLSAALGAVPPPAFDKRPGADLIANPSQIVQRDGTGLGVTELTWHVPDGVHFEIHVNAPNGALFTAGQRSGRARTNKWVKDGMEFLLQDVTGGKPLTREHTLAAVKVKVIS